jgi:hypothetical protein
MRFEGFDETLLIDRSFNDAVVKMKESKDFLYFGLCGVFYFLVFHVFPLERRRVKR